MTPQSSLGVDDAVGLILERVEPLPARPFSLDASLGRVLTEDLISREDHPPFDNSAMDGFAVVSSDLQTPPRLFPVLEDIAAGVWPQKAVTPGTVSRIMTGAPMPEGADSVVMVEDTSKVGDQIEIRKSARPGDNIRRKGEHLKTGQTGHMRGQVMTPAAVALAGYLGYAQPLCVPAPRVAVVSTGDELVEPGPNGWPLGPGQIRNSNAYGLEAKLRNLGCGVTRLPAVPDDPAVIAEVLKKQLEENDALITSAGVSMGEKDYVLRVLAELGAELHFWKVAMRPGRPLGFGTWRGKPIFALPGNPVSSMVTFEIFCRPALLKMMGHTRLKPRLESVRSAQELVKKDELRLYYRCRLQEIDGETWATPTGRQDSHLLNSLVEADALLILPEGQSIIAKGDRLSILRADLPASQFSEAKGNA